MAGQYTDIVEIAVPASALAGSTVNIEVRVKNTYSSSIGIMVGGALEYGVTPWPGISFPVSSANVGPGATQTFYGSFKMPASNVRIHIYSYWYGTDGLWHLDDEQTRDISLAELAPEFSQFAIADYSVV